MTTSNSITRVPPGRRVLEALGGADIIFTQLEMGSSSASDEPLKEAAVCASKMTEATASSMTDATDASNGE